MSEHKILPISGPQHPTVSNDMMEKEDKLFALWKKEIQSDSGAIFVDDGIVDEQEWNKSPIKVIYLLKEVNGGDKEWDERDYLKRYNTAPQYIKTHSPSIDALLRWQYGITKGSNYTWSEVENALEQVDIQNQLLSQFALVNVKKTAGGSVVDWSKFDPYFNNVRNREFLKKQLAIYNADLVICGGTAWHLCEVMGWDYNDWKETKRGVRYYKMGQTVYLDFCHPNIRAPRNIVYYALVDAVSELLVK